MNYVLALQVCLLVSFSNSFTMWHTSHNCLLTDHGLDANTLEDKNKKKLTMTIFGGLEKGRGVDGFQYDPKANILSITPGSNFKDKATIEIKEEQPLRDIMKQLIQYENVSIRTVSSSGSEQYYKISGVASHIKEHVITFYVRRLNETLKSSNQGVSDVTVHGVSQFQLGELKKLQLPGFWNFFSDITVKPVSGLPLGDSSVKNPNTILLDEASVKNLDTILTLVDNISAQHVAASSEMDDLIKSNHISIDIQSVRKGLNKELVLSKKEALAVLKNRSSMSQKRTLFSVSLAALVAVLAYFAINQK